MNTEIDCHLEDGRALRQIFYKVRPSPDHPLFWAHQCGILSIWLYAATNDDAIERATPILAALPFEKITEQAAVKSNLPRQAPLPAKGGAPFTVDLDAIIVNHARMVGCFVYFFAWPLGTNEEDLTFDAPVCSSLEDDLASPYG